ncbi:MAG TPA: response regulator [Chthoniobacterales bacterium]|jgi:DNA-binding response OmpR family regulator
MPTELTKNARIIVVDDEPMNIDLFGAILRDAGYENQLMITDSRQAVSLFANDNPDLVLLDLHMPFQDGYEVLQSLRYLVPAEAFLPILVLTADVTVETRRRALAAGATDFLSKPFDVVEMTLRIETMIRLRYLYRQMLQEKAVLEQRVKERTRSLQRVIAELRCTSLPLFATNI